MTPSKFEGSILDLLGEVEEYKDIPEPVSTQDLRNAIQPPLVGTGCEGCGGRCCTAKFGFTSLSLTRSEAMSLRFVDKAYPRHTWNPDTDDWLYPMTEDCQYKEPSGLCSIYEERPYACRGFLCYADQGPAVAKAVRNWTELYDHLRSKGVLPKADGGFFAEIPQPHTTEDHMKEIEAELLSGLGGPANIDPIDAQVCPAS